MALVAEDAKVGDVVKTADGCSQALRVADIFQTDNSPWSYARLVSMKDGKFIMNHMLGDLRVVTAQ